MFWKVPNKLDFLTPTILSVSLISDSYLSPNPVDFMVETELDDSFLTEDLLELCILAKLVAEARLIPGFILWTRLGLVRDPF